MFVFVPPRPDALDVVLDALDVVLDVAEHAPDDALVVVQLLSPLDEEFEVGLPLLLLMQPIAPPSQPMAPILHDPLDIGEAALNGLWRGDDAGPWVPSRAQPSSVPSSAL